MKYTYITDITAHYVEFDLLSAGGKKFKDTSVLAEYFEISTDNYNLYHAPTLIPKKYNFIIELIAGFFEKKQSLAQMGISLELRDQDGKCRFYCVRFDSKKGFTEIKNHPFDRRDWAQIEEILLSTGVQISKKIEYREITYRIKKLQASFVLLIKETENNLKIEAPDEEKLIKAMAVIGKSVEEVTIKDRH